MIESPQRGALPLGIKNTVSKAASVFFVVLLLGWVAGPLLGPFFGASFQALGNAALSPLTFGEGGHVAFVSSPAGALNSAERDSSWNAGLVLRVDGVAERHTIAVNPRRLLYLPVLVFVSCIAAARISPRRKGYALLSGVLLLVALSVASAWVIAAWLFARVPGLVYTLAPWQNAALQLAYEAFVTPLANKFIVPLLLALVVVALQRVPASRAAASGPPADLQTTGPSHRPRRARAKRKR